MKRKTTVILISLFLTGIVNGCQSRPAETTAAYIGIDAAKTAALTAAGISPSDASFSAAGLDNRNGTFFYQVTFTAEGMEYDYAIDAFTGVVIEGSEPAAPEDTAPSAETSPADTVPETAESSSPEVSPSASGVLDEAAALDIVLEHAGVSEDDTRQLEIKRDYEDRTAIYKIEFDTGSREQYEYKIDASTGAIVSYEYEQDGHNRETLPPGSTVLSEEQIREIVQKRVPGAPSENIFLHLDEDDGRMEYEGTLFYDHMEYEFKIDACSGSVIEWDAERTGTGGR